MINECQKSKKTIKIIADINATDLNKKTKGQGYQGLIFETKINKIDKHFARHIKIKIRKLKPEMNRRILWNLMTTNLIRGCYEQFVLF